MFDNISSFLDSVQKGEASAKEVAGMAAKAIGYMAPLTQQVGCWHLPLDL